MSYGTPAQQRGILVSEALLEELRAHVHEEYRSFMQRHEKTPRVLPELQRAFYMTDDEWELRQQNIREALEREPLWGQHMERLWPELAGP